MQTGVFGNNIWRRELSEGDEIIVERGVLWLTIGAQDTILRAGERIRLQSNAEVMGQALASGKNTPHAQFRLCQPTAAKQTAGRFARNLRERIPFFRPLHPLG